MTRQIEIPVETVKIEIVEKILEKIVEKEKLVYVETKAEDDCECISEAHFCEYWNKLMTINFKRTGPSEDCVTKEKFLDMIHQNISANFSEAKKLLPPK